MYDWPYGNKIDFNTTLFKSSQQQPTLIKNTAGAIHTSRLTYHISAHSPAAIKAIESKNSNLSKLNKSDLQQFQSKFVVEIVCSHISIFRRFSLVNFLLKLVQRFVHFF